MLTTLNGHSKSYCGANINFPGDGRFLKNVWRTESDNKLLVSEMQQKIGVYGLRFIDKACAVEN